MADDFQAAVEDGLRLSKRIFGGSERAVAPPRPPPAMDRYVDSYLPTCPMIYAVISNPEIVDNPDMPSYQPYVHGNLDPPALMPLQMNRIAMEVDCCAGDTAVVSVAGTWRLHCVMGSRSCDCRIAVPMGEQGLILGVEVEVPMRSFSTQIAFIDSETCKKKDIRTRKEKVAKVEEPYLNPHIFMITIPKIDGGTNISVKLRWSQKVIYRDGQYTLQIPYTFPEYVAPARKKIPRHEKILINVNPGPGTEVLCMTSSHPLKEQPGQTGKWSYLYDAGVLSWSSNDLVFSYTKSSNDPLGTVLLDTSPSQDGDDKGIFYCHLLPGNKLSEKVFKKEVVFVVDVSGSMGGKPLEDAKRAITAALEKLGPEDRFNIIVFNNEMNVFSSSMHPTTASDIEKATEWVESNFVAGGGTNILVPLNQAMEMLTGNHNSTIPFLFLITDGSVEDERHICDVMKDHLASHESITPRIYTLGIGSFCNQYFLQKLALISRGHHEAAIDADSIEERLGRLFDRASSIFLADVVLENLDEVEGVEVFPNQIPDLSSRSPTTLLGRYHGTFLETLEVKGTLPDMSRISIELNVQNAGEGMPISKIVATQEIKLLTAEAWYSDGKELKKQITDKSIQNAIISEYTYMVMFETVRRKTIAKTGPKTLKATPRVADSHGVEESPPRKILLLCNIGVGFGNLHATTHNVPSGSGHCDNPEAAEHESGCCGNLCNMCCGMYCIRACSKMNEQLSIALTQLCCGFTCWGCFECCDLCCCCDGQSG